MSDVKRIIELVFSGTDQLSDKIDSITKSFDKSQASIDKFAEPIAGATEEFLKFEAAIVAAGAALGVFAISEAVKFQDSTTALDQVLGETTRSVESFGDSAIDLSNKFGVAATDVQDSFASFSSAGFAADQIEDLTGSVLKFSAASGTDATQATDALVRILKGFNADASESPAILDKITANTDKYATNVDQMSEALARSSAIGRLSNLTIEETIGVLTPMVEVFQSAELASTAFNAVMQRLTSDNKNVTDALKELNVAQTDSNGKMRTAKDILSDVQKAYTTLDGSQKPVITNLIAGAEHAAKFTFVFDGLQKTSEATAQALAGVGTAVDERLKKRLDDTSFVLKQVGVQFQNAAIEAGGPFLTGVNNLAGGLSKLALQLQEIAKSEQFKRFAALINEELAGAGLAFEKFAAALPEALKRVNLDAFLAQLKLLGTSFDGLFEGVDLTTPEGLASAFQKIVDIGTQVIAFNRGLIEGLTPAIKAFQLVATVVSELPPGFSTLIGAVAGLTTGWTLLSPAISLASSTLGGFGKLLGAGGTLLRDLENTGTAISKLKSGPTSIAALAVAVGVAGYEIGTALNNYVINPIAQSVTGFATLGEAVAAYVHGPADAFSASAIEQRKQLNEMFVVQNELTLATKDAGIAWDVYGGGIDAITGKFAPFSLAAKNLTDLLNQQQEVTSNSTAEYAKLTSQLELTADAFQIALQTFEPGSAELESVAQQWKSAADQVDLYQKGIVDVGGVWMQIKSSGDALAQTTESLSEKQEKAADKAARLALESEKLDLEIAKLESHEREIVFQASVDLHIAEVERQAAQFEAIMESLNTAIESTGEGILGLAKLFVESDKKLGVGSEIQSLLRKEEERREKAFEQQKKLIDAQLRYLQVSTDRLARGDALITINAEGIEEELRMVLFKIIDLARIEASKEAGPLLLGIPNL